MKSLLFLLFLLLLIPACTEDNPTSTDSLGTVTFIIDGVSRTAVVDTMRSQSGEAVISARWNEPVFVNGAPVTLLLRSWVIVPESLDTHQVMPTSDSAPASFQVLLGVVDPTGAGSVRYRADSSGGSGAIMVTTLDENSMSGSFDVMVYSERDPSEVKNVTGNFEVRR